jgi:hypothetical protein
MTPETADKWYHKLFHKRHAAQLRYDVTDAMLAIPGVRWATMRTMKGRYLGINAVCWRCDRGICRIAWNLHFSTREHLDEQRALLCCFLKLPPYYPQDANTALPIIVGQRHYFQGVVEPANEPMQPLVPLDIELDSFRNYRGAKLVARG